eukprot:11887902-Ditylum_brightwellii.AAC.1
MQQTTATQGTSMTTLTLVFKETRKSKRRKRMKKKEHKSRRKEKNQHQRNGSEEKEQPSQGANETVQEQIKAAKETDIGERTRYTSRLRVEFNLGLTNKTFKTRNKLLHLVHKLAIANNSVCIKSNKGKDIWMDDKKFPSEEAFKEEF